LFDSAPTRIFRTISPESEIVPKENRIVFSKIIPVPNLAKIHRRNKINLNLNLKAVTKNLD